MHRLYRSYFVVFYAVSDTPGTATPEEEQSTLDILMEDVDAPKDDSIADNAIPGAEVEDGAKEETDEDPEKEEEIKVDDIEEELDIKAEDLGFTPPVIRKELLAAFPDIFKKFPHLEKAIYREKEYGSIFPTIEDAKVAVEKAQLLDNYEGEVLGGNVERLFKTIKDSNPQGFGKLVDNYFAVLDRVDPYAKLHVIGNIGRQLVYEMGVQGQQINNDNLKGAAVILNQFLFGNNQFSPPQNFGGKEQPLQSAEIEQQRAALLNNQFNTVLEEEYSRARGSVKSAIEKHIDPKNAMSEFVKSTAIDKCIETVEKAISSDSRFRGYLNSLWQKAIESNFSASSRSNIRRAYLGKAQSVLKQSIQITRQSALKGLGPASRPDKDRSGPVAQGRSPSNSGGTKTITKASQIPREMSTRDFIMRDD